MAKPPNDRAKEPEEPRGGKFVLKPPKVWVYMNYKQQLVCVCAVLEKFKDNCWDVIFRTSINTL